MPVLDQILMGQFRSGSGQHFVIADSGLGQSQVRAGSFLGHGWVRVRSGPGQSRIKAGPGQGQGWYNRVENITNLAPLISKDNFSI